jgi:outer membrane immunogenic protein
MHAGCSLAGWLEYDHLFMGDRDNTFFSQGVNIVTHRIKEDVDMVTARLNYKFGGPVVARC